LPGSAQGGGGSSRILESGNRDERCYRDGHTWDDPKPYFWNWVNGSWKRCLICDREVVEDEEAA